jgi:hypothetical protein
MPADAGLRVADETVLRLFPVLRRAWGLRGEQVRSGLTGRNAKRVLFGALTPRTGHRIVERATTMRQEHFQSFLRRLRRAYRERPIWLLGDEAPCHSAPSSQALTAHLNIELVWLLLR